ncbi:MAG: hypothetical protein ABIV47_24655 [Roseiflexaceae bacterium]
MTDSQLPTTRSKRDRQVRSLRVYVSAGLAIRQSSAIFVSLIITLLLAGCSITLGPGSAQAPASGGSFSPEAVAQSFFDDLGSALDDPKLADDQQRGAWVERLAGYFAPNERDDQRIALRDALDSFTAGLGKLEPNEDLTLKLKIERLEQVQQTDDRALIRPINAAIYVLITRTTSAGTQNLYEETVPLEKIIGNGGSVPVLRIGRSWYLTEG